VSDALPDGAWVNPDIEGAFSLDTVVLDVDGVLVDVRESFREAVRETVVEMQRAAGVRSPWRPSHEDIAVFKRAGGFNDDIDLGVALTAIGLAERTGDVAEIAAQCERVGGGLKALRFVAPGLPRILARDVVRIFDELYFGGLVEREVALVGPEFCAELRQVGARSVALVTGRTPRELDAAMRRLQWRVGELCGVVTGDMVRKPDPQCLDLVVQQCGPSSMVYVGDVRDDWELVRAWREERPGSVPVRGVLIGDDVEMECYRSLGVDATLRNTADVLSMLARWA